jgi:glycosyltransferase involved in cell wall biosynthesis
LRSYGAVETQMMGHARGLVDAGHEVHVLTVGDREQESTELLDGIRFHRLGASFEGHGRRRATGLLESQARFGRRARQKAEQLAPQIVHCHSRYPCAVGFTTASDRWRTIYHCHNWKLAERMDYHFLSPRRAAALLGARIDRRIARRCDHLIAISGFIRARVLETTKRTEEDISILTNIVDNELFSPEPKASRRDGILFVGRIAAEKGVATLIEAMAKVARSAPGAVLTIVGPGADGTERGGYLRDCRGMVRTLGLEACVRFVGEVPNAEMPRLLRSARVLVVPSVWEEPCGVVVLEGLACGTPVVASRVGGIPELVDEGQTGLLVSAKDPEALAVALNSALTDRELQDSAARFGPRVVAERHTWRAVGGHLLTIYERVLGARGARV